MDGPTLYTRWKGPAIGYVSLSLCERRSKYPLENSFAHICCHVPPSDVRNLVTDDKTWTTTRLWLLTCAASYVDPYKVTSDSVESGRRHTQRYAAASVDTCEESKNTKQGCVEWAGGVGRKR